MFFALTFIALFVAVKSQGCSQPLGFENGGIADSQFTASSFITHHEPNLARLNRNDGAGAWCSKGVDEDFMPWIKVTFTEKKRIRKIAVQGRNGTYRGWFVESFKVLYLNGNVLRPLSTLFGGPTSKNNIKYINVDIETTTLVIKPLTWYPYNRANNATRVCLRMEAYGCKASADFCAAKNCEHSCVNKKDWGECKCPPGFRVKRDGTCKEIDECAEQRDLCDTKTTTCVNTIGSYSCHCQAGLKKERYNNFICYDINECYFNNGGCQQNCINTPRSYHCTCNKGFTMANDSRSCIDNDECLNGESRCDVNTTSCNNTPGSYNCECAPGLKFTDNQKLACQDIDECALNNGGCEETCTNTRGSFYCSCPKGTYLKSKYKCYDLNECKKNNGGCEQGCRNFYTGFDCYCYQGYRLKTDNKNCEDVDECSESSNGKGSCEYKCKNTIGSFVCSCSVGYELNSDGETCRDIDECSRQLYQCDAGSSTCVNTRGSYECRCLPGFKKDNKGGCTAHKCPPLTPAIHGFIQPSDCILQDAKHFKDVCTFQCNRGFELDDKSVRTAFCNQDGRWDFRGGYQALCQRMRCSSVPKVAGGSLVPAECGTNGAQYGERCQVYCNNGLKLQGRNLITCQSDGNYDGHFNDTKCMSVAKLECPADVSIVLPLGASSTILPRVKLTKELDPTTVRTVPAGVLTGDYKFASDVQGAQAVQVISKLDSQQKCGFYVTVEDHEPPHSTNCPDGDVYVTINSLQGMVTWPNPQFRDNVHVSKVIQNLQNNQILYPQVYFVYYAALDAFKNKASCRFFVHVRARYCDKSKLPGGEGGTKVWFPSGVNSLSVFLTCPTGKTFSANVTGASIFRCLDGVWGVVPDCVSYVDKINGSCPAGHVTVIAALTKLEHCAKCPKGSMEIGQECQKCPVGSYQDQEGQTSCLQCPLGKRTITAGGRSVAECEAQCTPGAYSPTGLYGSKGCDRCPEGSFQDLHGQRSCKLCPNGGKSDAGAKSEGQCFLPARVSKILPDTEAIYANASDTIVVKCFGTGNPAPFMKITSVNKLPPDSFRGKATLQPLATGNKYISGIQLTITNAKAVYDTQVYKCSADNRGNLDEREFFIIVK